MADKTSSTPQVKHEPEPEAKQPDVPGTPQEPSPSDKAEAALAKKHQEEVEELVKDRAKDRVVQQGVPLPQTSTYMKVPGGLKVVSGISDPPYEPDMPAQVAQIQTLEGGRPALVTFRYDNGQEFVVEWDQDTYDKVTQYQDHKDN